MASNVPNVNPLDSLYRTIEEAAEIPPPEPHVPSVDPLATLRARWTQTEDTPTAPATGGMSAPQAAPGADSLEALIGREVLAMIGDRPLPPDARAEAVRRSAVALQNPSAENVRAILAVLVTGRADG